MTFLSLGDVEGFLVTTAISRPTTGPHPLAAAHNT